MNTFGDFKIKKQLQNAIADLGFEKPTPIQQESYSTILGGSDFVWIAQTGTGKTAAFTLPLLHLLSDKPRHKNLPRALVLAPTRELAAQVAASVEEYGQGLHIESTVIFGGVGYAMLKCNIPRVPMILGLILGPLVERSYQVSMQLSDGSLMIFFTRPYTIAFLVLIPLSLFLSIFLGKKRMSKTKSIG